MGVQSNGAHEARRDKERDEMTNPVVHHHANPHTSNGNAGIAAWRAKLRYAIGSHKDAYDFLYDEGALLSRVLGPHMVVRRERTDPSDPIEVVLYDTPIIRYYNDGTFSVDNGGWNTPTTRERLASVLPDGFWAYHHQKRLGLLHSRSDVPHAGSARRGWTKQPLWPLDHTKHIDPTKGEVVS